MRAGFKSRRDAALREWRELLDVWHRLTREMRRRVRIRLTASAALRLRLNVKIVIQSSDQNLPQSTDAVVRR